MAIDNIKKRATNTQQSKLEYNSFMIYMTEGCTEVKTHNAQFTTRLQCFLNKTSNGKRRITSTKTICRNQTVNLVIDHSSQQMYIDD